MTKWDKLFGLDHPEAYGKIEDPKKPEDNEKYLFNSDRDEINHKMLLLLCKKLDIKLEWIWRDYGKTEREQFESHGMKYKG